jgi:serine/threonine protein phosphatase PrpC
MGTHAVAVSDVGRVRASNQDSGYAGTFLSVVADGMGGHAGGDVASHVVVRHLLGLDREFDSAEQARSLLVTALLECDDALGVIVADHPELAGLGTTVSAMIRVGHEVAIAHIGDSRIYRRRGDELEQLTDDHTFVQRLIDSGRITEEEAHDHPRRSVLMRVLGDVNSLPEIDSSVVDTQPGDLWMLCSDGLTTVVHRPQLTSLLTDEAALARSAPDTAAALLEASLAGGAPDNVTVIVVPVDDSAPEHSAQLVGSAAGLLPIPAQRPTPAPEAARASTPRTTVPPAPRSLPVSTDGVPVSPQAISVELESTRARRRQRRLVFAGIGIVVSGALAVAGILGYRWTQTQYYVAADTDTVVIYQGISQNAGPFVLSHLAEDTQVPLTSLTAYQRSQVSNTIPVDSLDAARALVNSLKAGAAK